MNDKQARKMLQRFNRWRRYDGEKQRQPKMPNPRKVGEAIDIACRVMSETAVMRDALEMIAANRRRTREQRLAFACITFLDSLPKESK